MGQIKVEKDLDGIKGLCLITPTIHKDNRGYFMEVYNKNDMAEAGLDINFVQDNQSMSVKGVLRGLHFQRNEWAQAKLVRVSRGRVIDVIVDIRKDSPTFGQHIAVELSEDNCRQLFVPRGMAHGFIVLSDIAQFQYKVDNVYAPQAEATLRFDDPALGIEWPLPVNELNLSEKDTHGLSLSEIEPQVV